MLRCSGVHKSFVPFMTACFILAVWSFLAQMANDNWLFAMGDYCTMLYPNKGSKVPYQSGFLGFHYVQQ